MNILVLASLTPPATANYLIRALRDGGNDVFVCSDVVSTLANVRGRGGLDVEAICAKHKLVPDLVLFIEGGTMRLFPTGLERMSCLTAWYGIDTHMDYAKHLRIGRLFDVTFIAQKEFVERLHQDGLRQVHWLPLACAPEIYPAENLDRRFDVAYVGSSSASVHPIRHALLASIRKEFPNAFIGTAGPQEMGRIYAQSKIVFNKSVNNDFNMRYFEAAGAGAVLLTDPARNNGIEEVFAVGEHYLEYHDEQMLLAQIRDLLRDPERCCRIADAVRRHALAHHTYKHRAVQLLEIVQLSHKLPPPRTEDSFPVLAALNLLDAAVACAARTLKRSTGGVFSKIVGRMAALLLAGLAVILGVLDKMRCIVR